MEHRRAFHQNGPHFGARTLLRPLAVRGAVTVAIFTRHEGFGLNPVTAVASVLLRCSVLLFVLATKETTAANAIFLQYTAPVYLLIFEPVFYKRSFAGGI